MTLKQLPEDFKDFIKFLNENKVRYLLIEGWAVGIYGNPRATKDIGFLIARDDDNIGKPLDVFCSFPHVNITFLITLI